MASTSVVFDLIARDRASDKFDKFGNAVDRSSGKLGKFGSIAGKVGKAAVLGIAGAASTGAVALFTMGQKAGDFNETISKTNQIFGKNFGGGLQKWAETADTSFGLSKQSALDAAATFGVFGKAAGKSGNELASFAAENTQLAADLASFNNTTPEEAIEALGAAFRGESEPLRRYGVLLDDASMRQQALRMGLVKTTTEALTPQQKILSAQALILKQTSDAQGDFERTSGGLANQQRILKAEFENVQVSIGQKMLPIMLRLATFGNETVLPFISKWGNILAGKLGPALQQVGTWISGTAVPAIRKFAEQMQNGEGAGGKFAAAVKRMQGALEGAWGILKPVLNFMANNKTVVATFAGVILTVVAAVKAWSIAQAILNVVLSANPIGIVVVAIAALAAGIVYAWKKSETFRTVVKSLWEAIKRFVGWTPLGAIISNFDTLKSAVESAVGWVKDLVSWISRIDFGKIKDVAGAIGGAIGKVLPKVMEDSGKKSGEAWFDSFTKALGGSAIRQRWRDFMNGLMADALTGMRSAIADLRDQRNQFADFRGFRGNLFGADISGAVGATTDEAGVTTPGPTGIAALRAFAATQRQNAQQLADDVARLTAMGISQDMLEDLKSQGSSGLAQIHALATASQEDFNAIMADMAEANRLNQIAGNEAAVRLDDQLASMGRVISGMARDLTAAVGQPPTVNIRMDLEGRTIVKTVKAEERATGRTYWYPVTI